MADDAVALPAGARRYEVGGAVRDALLGRPAGDRDWVVVGTTPQAMADAGFRPVGRDFPVFLHPATHEEHALARTERKTAPGYHGFVFHAAADVTLEQDLARRDLTINAMARDEAGRLVDPHGGARDLHDRVLRHVSPAFAEDPVRILRLARFAARFADFTVAPETDALLRAMVDAGEVDALVAERVWQEVSRGLMERRPSRMLAVLAGCGALPRLVPAPLREAAVRAGTSAGAALDAAAALGAPVPVRFALLAAALAPAAAADDPPHAVARTAATEALAAHWRVDGDSRDRAALLAREAGSVARSAGWDADAVTAFLDRCDAWRRPARVHDLVLAERARTRGEAAGTAPAGTDGAGTVDQAGARLLQALAAATAVDTGDAARRAAASGARGAAIGAAVLAQRARAVHTAITSLSRLG